MRGRPLSEIAPDELAEMVNVARQEYDILNKKFGGAIGFQHEVISYLAITVAVQATIRNLEADEFYARPWYKRLLP